MKIVSSIILPGEAHVFLVAGAPPDQGRDSPRHRSVGRSVGRTNRDKSRPNNYDPYIRVLLQEYTTTHVRVYCVPTAVESKKKKNSRPITTQCPSDPVCIGIHIRLHFFFFFVHTGTILISCARHMGSRGFDSIYQSRLYHSISLLLHPSLSLFLYLSLTLSTSMPVHCAYMGVRVVNPIIQ